MPFLSKLVAEFKQGEIGAFLHEPLGYQSPEYDVEIWVPTGFSTDWGSVPELLVDAIVNPVGKTGAAFVVHDYLYKQVGLVPSDLDPPGKRLSRQAADDIMRLAMIDCGEDPWRCRVAYWGVRIGGRVPWRKYRDG